MLLEQICEASKSKDGGEWEDRGNGVKVKIGKRKPTKAPSFGDSMDKFSNTPRSRKRRQDTDDGSRGLSAAERNR